MAWLEITVKTTSRGVEDAAAAAKAAGVAFLNGVELDCVYTTGSTDYIYPTEACVFRTTVMDRNEVYCWIDLVYSEYWDPYLETDSGKNMLDNEIITRLSPNWCIVKLYGY